MSKWKNFIEYAGTGKEKKTKIKALYKKKLIIPGWAGDLDDTEAGYVAEKLNADPVLRRQWQKLAGVKRRHKRISPAMAKTLAEELATTPRQTFDSGLFRSERILKHRQTNKTIHHPNFETITAHCKVLSDPAASLVMPHRGRPRKSGEVSRATKWRRQQEQQGVLL